MPQTINTTIFRHLIAMTQKAFADIPEEQMRSQPVPVINPPAWQLGHMCMALNGALKLLGGAPVTPPEYDTWFGNGSKVADLPAELPSAKEMLAKMGQIAEMILATLPGVTPEHLAKPNPTRLFKAELPTVGDFAENLLTVHHTIHLGQLSVWRRLMGMTSVINF